MIVSQERESDDIEEEEILLGKQQRKKEKYPKFLIAFIGYSCFCVIIGITIGWLIFRPNKKQDLTNINNINPSQEILLQEAQIKTDKSDLTIVNWVISYSNADYIYNFFKGKGWSLNAICALLGNICHESAGVYPDKTESGGGGGYGLVQWTPKSKLTNWANQYGYDYRTLETQCRRIQYEMETKNSQWLQVYAKMSFYDFSVSTSSVDYLVEVFMRNYERPNEKYAALANRRNYAADFYNRYSGYSPTPTPTPTPVPSGVKWLPAVSGYSKTDSKNGYAGIFGYPVKDLRVSGGTHYRVHVYGGGWLPAVTGNNINDANNGYAGNHKAIDAVAIQSATYAVHIKGSNWLPAVTGYNINDGNNGYAGIIGKQIDAVMISGRTYATSY